MKPNPERKLLPVIAIDGPAASGKGTLSRNLAQALAFAHLDTGALYRAVAVAVLARGGDPENETTAVSAAKALKIKPEDLQDPVLRTDEAGKAASKVSRFPAVRQALFDFQRNFAQNPPEGFKGAVLDGRDIGTIICPEAPLKLFVTATLETRAGRRLKELQSKGIEATYEAVLKDMRARDERDSGRDTAPLKPHPDAVIIDTSNMGEDEVLEQALLLARSRLS